MILLYRVLYKECSIKSFFEDERHSLGGNPSRCLRDDTRGEFKAKKSKKNYRRACEKVLLC